MVWGLRVGALTSSLLLNLEAVHRALALIHREPLGGRMTVGGRGGRGGVLLAPRRVSGRAASVPGSRRLSYAGGRSTRPDARAARRGPRGRRRGRPGSARLRRWRRVLAATAGRTFRMRRRATCGAIGYGAPAALPPRAAPDRGEPHGSTRDGPFVGAFFGWVLGDRCLACSRSAAGGAFAVGAYLHLTERRAPPRPRGHVHEHAHRHDDWHHTHVHDGRSRESTARASSRAADARPRARARRPPRAPTR
jgi:hypothetical protein